MEHVEAFGIVSAAFGMRKEPLCVSSFARVFSEGISMVHGRS